MTDAWQIVAVVLIIVAVLGLLGTAVGRWLRRKADVW